MRRVMLSMIFLLLLVLPVAAQDATPSTPEEQCFAKSGTINTETGQCELHMNLDIVMDYPLEFSDYPFIESAIDDYYTQARTQFMNNATESGFSPSPVFNWAQDISYEILTQNDSLVSMIFYDYEYTGGAHGMTYLQPMTFDLETGTQLTLEDLFPDGAVPYEDIAAFSATTIEERLGVEGTFPEGYTADPANYQFWTVGEDGLTIYFPAYQVAPYAAGIQTVTISFFDLGIETPFYFTS